MARMAEEKAQHAELKAMARNIIEGQQKEVSQMKAWRDGWFASQPPAMNMEMPGMMDSMKDSNMAKMESASGAQFDLAFLNMMIPHHAGAVTMSKDALAKAEHSEIKRLAQRIIDEQQQEIGEMNNWKAAWSK